MINNINNNNNIINIMNNSFNNLNYSRVFSKAGNVIVGKIKKKIIIIVQVKIINYKKVNF